MFAALATWVAVFVYSQTVTAQSGRIIGASVNGTSNELQLISANLSTYEVSPLGPPLLNFEPLGQAAVVIGNTLWTCLLNIRGGATLVGFDVDSGAVVASLPTVAWPGVDGGDAWLEGAFVQQPAGLLLVGFAPRAKLQLLWSLNLTSLDVQLVAVINTSSAQGGCLDFGDPAFDSATNRLYLTCASAYDDPAGNVVLAVDATPGPGAGAVVGSFFVPNHFDFAQACHVCTYSQFVLTN